MPGDFLGRPPVAVELADAAGPQGIDQRFWQVFRERGITPGRRRHHEPFRDAIAVLVYEARSHARPVRPQYP